MWAKNTKCNYWKIYCSLKILFIDKLKLYWIGNDGKLFKIYFHIFAIFFIKKAFFTVMNHEGIVCLVYGISMLCIFFLNHLFLPVDWFIIIYMKTFSILLSRVSSYSINQITYANTSYRQLIIFFNLPNSIWRCDISFRISYYAE